MYTQVHPQIGRRGTFFQTNPYCFCISNENFLSLSFHSELLCVLLSDSHNSFAYYLDPIKFLTLPYSLKAILNLAILRINRVQTAFFISYLKNKSTIYPYILNRYVLCLRVLFFYFFKKSCKYLFFYF